MQNSGIPQGTFLKRCKLTKADGGSYTAEDLHIGMDFPIFGRLFKLYDCDQFTRTYYENVHHPLAAGLNVPSDEYTITRDQITAMCGGDHDHFYGKKTYPLKTYMEASLGNPIRSRLQSEKKRKFLANSRKVLCFHCEYDERDQLYGDLNYFTLDYFLEDDTIEIKEVFKTNSGKDPFPILLRRGRLLKDWTKVLADEQDRGVEEPTSRESYYNEEDLVVGATLNVYGRSVKLVDADPYTRDYYQVAWGRVLADAMYTKVDKVAFKRPDPPPYNGYGTEEDSLGSCNHLVPKPPKKDFKKMAEFDRKLLRFSARKSRSPLRPGPGGSPEPSLGRKLFIEAQASIIVPSTEQQQRRFIITYFLTDDTAAIYEPEQRNSGIVNGKFLERGTYKSLDGERYTMHHFKVGAELAFNAFRFEILDADEYTKKFMAS